jgi:hypothetical protein
MPDPNPASDVRTDRMRDDDPLVLTAMWAGDLPFRRCVIPGS